MCGRLGESSGPALFIDECRVSAVGPNPWAPGRYACGHAASAQNPVSSSGVVRDAKRRRGISALLSAAYSSDLLARGRSL